MRMAPKVWLVVWLCFGAHAATRRYWIEPCTKIETGCRASDTELARWAVEAWQAAARGNLTLERTAIMAKAHIRLYWASGRDGLYGEARPIQVDGVSGAEVYVQPNVVPPEETDRLLRDAIVYLTCLHETGHALGLRHTAEFADIMYSFQYGGDIREYFGRYRRQLSVRSDIQRHSGMSDHDRQVLAAMFR